MGNIHDMKMKSTQSIFKIQGDEVGSCFTIERHETIPMNHCPEMPLGADAVKGTCYEDVDDEVALIALPIVAPLPFGFDLKSLIFGRRLCRRNEEGFWAQQMYNAFDQHDKDLGTVQVVKNLTNIITTRPYRRLYGLVVTSTLTSTTRRQRRTGR